VKCRQCLANIPDGVNSCPKCGFPANAISVAAGDGNFLALESDGFIANQAGFFITWAEEWCVSELTYLSGIMEERGEDGKLKRYETVQPVLFYNHTNNRGCTLLKDANIHVGGRLVRLNGKTLGAGDIPTLMDMDACRRFLDGEGQTLEAVFQSWWRLSKNTCISTTSGYTCSAPAYR